MIIAYKGKTPKIADDVFIAPTAVIIGDVEIKQGASVWFNAVLRGDMAAIRIGKNTNVQDNCTIHNDFGKPAIIGDNVTIGHNAIIHGCTIAEHCLIGINATVLSDAVVKTGAVVAAGSVVTERSIVEPWKLVAGAPAREKKDLTPLEEGKVNFSVQNYMNHSKIYRSQGIGTTR